jgi:hypothetical protein
LRAFRRGRVLSWMVAGAVGAAGEAGASGRAEEEFFEERIRPVLASECYECHGASKQKGGLRLDDRAGLLKGGESGKALVAGDAKGSLLIGAIGHAGELKMPKDRPRLAARVVEDFKTWINRGAYDPRDAPPAAGEVAVVNWEAVVRSRRDWWSFQPLQRGAAPAAGALGAHPVDSFVAEKLNANGLEPAAAADRRTLLRRVTYVLTGMPPTLDEMAAFVGDESAEAFARVVERLLESPRFGEHWARHWMDLTRFSETHGSEGDPAIADAWRYRDYLIRGMNADVPWDQLIREHVAGDLLAKPRLNEAEGLNESVIGLAQLRMVEHGFQPVDTLDEQVKTLDNQIDVVTKAFQGLTVTCARCHDHKFDPISQRDYYRLYGVFASSPAARVSIDLPARLKVNREELEKIKLELKSVLAKAWTRSADDLYDRMTGGGGGSPPAAGAELAAQIVALEADVAKIDQQARVAALQGKRLPTAELVEPIGEWSFDGDATDKRGGLHGELQGGAMIRNGRLVLDGKGAFLRTAALARPLQEKSLEAWVTIADPAQRGGGVLTVQTLDGKSFDSVVYAEQAAGRWLAGSEGHQRSRDVGGVPESAAADELVHVLIVYQGDGRITIFRNGVVYGQGYQAKGAATRFAEGGAQLLMGMRHTGGGNPFFAGQIEEARLYERALSAAEVAASFHAGPERLGAAEILAAMSPAQRAAREALVAKIGAQRVALDAQFPDFAAREAARAGMVESLQQAAKNPAGPLFVWQQLRDKPAEAVASAWQAIAKEHGDRLDTIRRSNQEKFTTFWESGAAAAGFALGVNPAEAVGAGEFVVETDGEKILTGLLPAAVVSHRLSRKHNGVFVTAPFAVTSDSISVRVTGGKGALVRLLPDQYPIGNGNIFPQAGIEHDSPTWVRLDTAYRKGSMAHLEFITAGDSLSRDNVSMDGSGRSFFAVSAIVFHHGGGAPGMEVDGLTHSLRQPPPQSADNFAAQLRDQVKAATAAWLNGSLTQEQRLLLDELVRGGLLPVALAEVPEAAALVGDYRRLEAAIPLPQRAPGVAETAGRDAHLLLRGNPLEPQEVVPRGYLEFLAAAPYTTRQSGRLELAGDLTRADNPLTSRVMVNRIWQHLFGRGLVATVDNFGRLGEEPSHPELLDFLAGRFMENRWSAKEMIRFLVTSRTWQLSSEPPPRALEVDPTNRLLSHARVRRLGAEAIRDSLLATRGTLETTMGGPGADALAGPDGQRRRSVYLTIRRNFPSPFLEAFNAPRPFTTLGERETTNIPAQSLTLLNDPFVINQARRWAGELLKTKEEPPERIAHMFVIAFGRSPTDAEQTAAAAYLADIAEERGELARWQDLAQSLFNFKEFIYLK